MKETLSKTKSLQLLTILAALAVLSDVSVVYCPTTVDFNPETLNLKSRGRYVTVFVYNETEVTVSSLTLTIQNSTGGQETIGPPLRTGTEDSMLVLKFSRSAVQDAIKELGGAGEYTAIVSGTFSNGTAFTGEDTFRAISPGRGPKLPKSPKPSSSPKPPKSAKPPKAPKPPK